MRCPFFAGKNIVVFGMGRTGIASIKALIKSNANVIASDDFPLSLLNAKEQVPDVDAKNIDEINWSVQDFLLLSPGVPLYGAKMHAVVKMAKQNHVKIISDIDVLYLAMPSARYIGITGTNGKSTTTALIGHILQENGLKVQVGGNIGIPVLSLQSDQESIYVLELSSFQLELLEFCYLDVSVFLNITPDHLDRHGDMQTYLDAKLNIFRRLQQKGQAIFSEDYHDLRDVCIDFTEKVGLYKHTFGVYNIADVYVNKRILHDRINGLSFDLREHQFLPGRHNEENIAAAYLAALSMGCKPDLIINSIKSFKGLEHRMEFIGNFNGITFINDSKATNSDSASKALVCYDNIYWIAGGVAKSEGIESLIPIIKENVKLTLLIGDAQEEFAKTLLLHKLPFYKVDTVEKALNFLKNLANIDIATVLFSPACASFDQFRDFEDRGKKFKTLVYQIFGDSC